MNIPKPVIAALVLIALAFGKSDLGDLGKLIPSLPGPAPAVATPSPELQTAVAGLKTALANHPNAGRIAAFFLECADEIRLNSGIASLDQVRQFNAQAGRAMVRRAGAAEGLGKLLDESLKTVAGDEPVALDPALRAKVAAWYEAVAWAAGG